MKRVTTKPIEPYSSRTHALLIALHRKHRKSFIVDSVNCSILPTLSSPNKKNLPITCGSKDELEAFLKESERQGYELYSLSNDEFKSFAGASVLCTSAASHFDLILSSFPNEEEFKGKVIEDKTWSS